jgi:hypothetical protein
MPSGPLLLCTPLMICVTFKKEHAGLKVSGTGTCVVMNIMY